MRKLALIAGAGALLVATTAHAYVREMVNGVGVKWAHLPVPYKINPHYSDGRELSALQAGEATWHAAGGCTAWTATYAGTTTVAKPNNDGTVEMMWPSTTDWVHGNGSTLAVTNTQFQNNGSGWTIVDGDIEFSPYSTFVITGDRNSMDLQSVATHEEGHMLGLDHTTVSQATMYYATSPGDTHQRVLNADDVNGVCAIYPNGQTMVGCTTAAQCQTGEICTNTMCVADPSLGGYGKGCTAAGACTGSGAFCLQYSDGSTVCSQACGAGCPNGDMCVNLQGGGTACRPGTGTVTPPTKQPFGGNCTGATDCTSGLCGADGKCTQTCTAAAGSCPSGYMCGNGNQCVVATVVNPMQGTTGLGGSCTTNMNCASNLCAANSSNPDEHFCTQLCTGSSPCPTGFACADAGGGSMACVVDTTTPGALGQPCTGGEMCNSNICASDGYCTQLCDLGGGCGAGFDCVPAGGGQNACAKHVGGKDTGSSSGGCSVGGTQGGSPLGLALIGLLMGLIIIRRRK